MMSKNSTTISNLLPDLEKGVTEVEKGEEKAIVDSQKAKLISRVWDACLVLYVLFFIGLMAFMVKVSHNWWDPWPGVLILLPINIGTIWLIPKTKKLYIELYATKRSLGNGSDLSTKLLASEKEAMGKSKCSW